MARAKSSKGVNSIPHKHIHSRLSFLHQAARYLATSKKGAISAPTTVIEAQNGKHASETTRLLTHLRGVSRKSQVRLTPKVKHTICKRCDCLLIAGQTSTEMIINPSKSCKKPWAELFEVRCNSCGTVKRFPIGMNVRKEVMSMSGAEATSGKTEQPKSPVI